MVVFSKIRSELANLKIKNMPKFIFFASYYLTVPNLFPRGMPEKRGSLNLA
jgi:hypothetical protein